MPVFKGNILFLISDVINNTVTQLFLHKNFYLRKLFSSPRRTSCIHLVSVTVTGAAPHLTAPVAGVSPQGVSGDAVRLQHGLRLAPGVRGRHPGQGRTHPAQPLAQAQELQLPAGARHRVTQVRQRYNIAAADDQTCRVHKSRSEVTVNQLVSSLGFESSQLGSAANALLVCYSSLS